MDLRKPLVVLALIGSLVACGDNTDLQRGETDCDSSSSNPHDASCKETGSNTGGDSNPSETTSPASSSASG